MEPMKMVVVVAIVAVVFSVQVNSSACFACELVSKWCLIARQISLALMLSTVEFLAFLLEQFSRLSNHGCSYPGNRIEGHRFKTHPCPPLSALCLTFPRELFVLVLLSLTAGL